MSFFGKVKFSDNKTAPSPAYGTGTALKGRDATESVLRALRSGLRHIDCAQFYENESSVGQAIKESGIPRSELFITTKWAKGDINQALQTSLRELGIDYVDLYLIHGSNFAEAVGINESWGIMESLQKEGLAKSIGVSNYRIKDLDELLSKASVKPVINQVEFHPFVFDKVGELLEYSNKHDIKLASYAGLAPITKTRNEDFDKLIAQLTTKYKQSEQAILYNWIRKHGVLVVTTTSKQERLDEIKSLAIDLADEDVKAIDHVGSRYHHRYYMSHMDE
ncbi:hypothetical protein E3P99_01677 [Wallemia hederae]|uniref:NADP-dependent oxidoreductase domain-containing protein n=1 Tax=Wallemia hederae TaxID=1540922 RepID=A0A4T0FNF1_9BASI|nr:hypothetical protein E3P99_01677 [Wallemia hederae]